MNSLNVFLLSSVPLSNEMQTETGAYFASEMMIGPDLLLAKAYKEIRAAVGPEVFINLVVLYPSSVLVMSTATKEAYLDACTEGQLDENLMLNTVEVDDASPQFMKTFEKVKQYLSNKHLPQGGSSGPVLILAGDTLIAKETGFFSVKSLTTRFRFLALPADDPNLDVPFRAMLRQSSRWTSIAKLPGAPGYVADDRPSEITFRPPAGLLYTGACSFENAAVLSDFLHEFKDRSKDVPDAEFFKCLFKFSGTWISSSGLPTLATCLSGFYDFGHVDTYWFSKLQNLAPRHFNGLRVDFETSTITKTSSSTIFKHQANWMYEAGRDTRLQHYVPTSNLELPSKGKKGELELVMSLVGSPSLSDMLVQNRPQYHWSVAADRVGKVFSVLSGTRSTNMTSHCLFQEACRNMYFEKTHKRLMEFFEQRPDLETVTLRTSSKKPVLISSQKVLETLPKYVKDWGLLNKPTYSPSLVHGDLCFSNILFDRRTTAIKIIDPRGDFGGLGKYGDAAYDLAKLMHSFNGLYDLILSRRLKLLPSKDGLTLENSADSRSLDSLDVFSRVFLDYVNKLVTARKLSRMVVARAWAIEPLLFLSMLPLHSDHRERQRVLYIRGLQLLYDNLNDWKKKKWLAQEK